MKNHKPCLLIITVFLFYALPIIAQESPEVDNYEKIRLTWNRILKNKRLYKREATTLLVETIKNLDLGKALDVAMGTGRNSIYLAKEGWAVTGFDLSDESIDSAKAQALRENVDIETILIPAEYFVYGEKKWDLISFLYADIICNKCLGNDMELIDKLKLSLKPGGILVYEWFTVQGIRDINQDQTINWGCSEGVVKEAFQRSGGFELILYEEEMGVPDYDPSYKFEPVKMIYMVVRKL